VSRSIRQEVTIDAPVDVVWRAITEADQLACWFPVEAQVEPGLGGSVWLSWGGGTEGRAPITAWEPDRRFGWTEERGPHKLAVDFLLEARGGTTIVRFVQSGFGDSSDWDDEFHLTEGGWSYFIQHLRWYLERHRSEPRDLISFRDAVTRPRPDALGRLTTALGLGDRKWIRQAAAGQPFRARTSAGDELTGTLVAVSSATSQLGLTINELNGAILFLEMEPAPTGARAGFWLSTYGLPTDQLTEVRSRFERLYRDALGV
jgi:uncharacterized protein YndB with AHSA1/START domain